MIDDESSQKKLRNWSKKNKKKTKKPEFVQAPNFFSYPRFSCKAQKKLLEKVDKICQSDEKSIVYVPLPTGTGKTAGVVVPILRNGKRVLSVTSQVGARWALLREVNRFNVRNNTHHSTCVFVNKARLCSLNETEGPYSPKKCADLKASEESCPHLRVREEDPERFESAVASLLKRIVGFSSDLDEGVLERQYLAALEEAADSLDGFCRYELNLEVGRRASAISADYNHVFFQRLATKHVLEDLSKYVLVVDEADQLADRLQDPRFYPAFFGRDEAGKPGVVNVIEAYEGAELRKTLPSRFQLGQDLFSPGGRLLIDLFKPLARAAHRYRLKAIAGRTWKGDGIDRKADITASELLSDIVSSTGLSPEALLKELTAIYNDIEENQRSFALIPRFDALIEFLVAASESPEEYVVTLEIGMRIGGVKLYSSVVSDACPSYSYGVDEFAHAIFMSATLPKNLDVFRARLGLFGLANERLIEPLSASDTYLPRFIVVQDQYLSSLYRYRRDPNQLQAFDRLVRALIRRHNPTPDHRLLLFFNAKSMRHALKSSPVTSWVFDDDRILTEDPGSGQPLVKNNRHSRGQGRGEYADSVAMLIYGFQQTQTDIIKQRTIAYALSLARGVEGVDVAGLKQSLMFFGAFSGAAQAAGRGARTPEKEYTIYLADPRYLDKKPQSNFPDYVLRNLFRVSLAGLEAAK